MPALRKPRFDYRYQLKTELEALREHATLRRVPTRKADRLLVATWNVANLGVHKRRPKDYALLSEVVGWFDVVALQEVNDDLAGLRALQAQLPDYYRVLFSEATGNEERGAFIYDSRKVQLLEKVGRLAIPPSQLARIKLPGSTQPFAGFDRGPYLAAFEAGAFRFLLVNVHLFYGSTSATDIERRSLEAFAVAYWADRRRKDKHAFTTDIIALGDFNLPRIHPTDPIFKALTSRGLVLRKPELREHLSVVGGSSLGGHKSRSFPARRPSSRQATSSTSTTRSSAASGATPTGPTRSSSTTSATTSPTTAPCGPRWRSDGPDGSATAPLPMDTSPSRASFFG
ncbi:MAG: endonuclease/exonuclease/phosphatase family protein [Solirubrobacterales bacterium]|nr:endonuclease/exonuclease/phosphatase family protein [Solirubrobacterales bacterium]